MSKLYLARHGESVFNLEGRVGGDSELSPKGRNDAEHVAELLSVLELNTIYCSTLIRSIQTAEIIQKRFPLTPLVKLDKLKELNFGIAEGLTHLEFERLCPDLFNQRKKQWYQFKFPDGESYEMVWDRINVFIEELKKFSGNYLVVAHGMVNKSIIGTLLNLGENLTTISIPHDIIFEIDLNNVLDIKRLTPNGKFKGIELIDYGQKSL